MRQGVPLILALAIGCGSEASRARPTDSDVVSPALRALALPKNPRVPVDVTNRFADDGRAAALGQRLFFDPRFSGPLLDDANNGGAQTLGMVGETGRVSCAGCHVPEDGFVDRRSTRGQLSFASSWTRRHTPTLLDVAQVKLHTWDGRRPTAYSVVFGVIESPIEFNSSRLFVAQELGRSYRADYEALFGAFPDLSAFAELRPADAGCTTLPADPAHEHCVHDGADDVQVTGVVVNFGKAIDAYMRLLSCGPSRFDDWVDGDASALTADEIAGAQLFVGKAGCDTCHSGPYFTDQEFHNIGIRGGLIDFTGVDTSNDPGAMVGLALARDDWLGPAGPFSDGDDGRLDALPSDLSTLAGAFRTPSLRCVSRHPSYMHNGQYRSLVDAISAVNKGGADSGIIGVSELAPAGLTREEIDLLAAFILALEGPGPDAALRATLKE